MIYESHGSATASPLLDAAAWRWSLLDASDADDAPIEALELAILSASRSSDRDLRERERQAQAEILLQRAEGVHDGLDPRSSDWEQLRPVIAYLYREAGLEVPNRLLP